MAQLPRIAVGTIQEQADSTAMLWALMDALETAGLRVQSFLSHAYFAPRDAATAITGLSPRHLDSWIMTPDVCREIFLRGRTLSDLAIVEGRFGSPGDGANLDTLCRWLDLPRLAIVDVRQLAECRLPRRPQDVDGLLLDCVGDTSEMVRARTLLETMWNIPVVGSLGLLRTLREAVDSIPSGTQPCLELCHALGGALGQNTNLERLYCLAASRAFPSLECSCCASRSTPERPLRVAVAYDEAFRGYFPDTLDLLEHSGATVSDFSPLADERLPADTDIVYFGCGNPERYLAELADNDCMLLALKSHLCSGRRIYAECGGLAYLCQQIEMPDGERWPMVGAFKQIARFNAAAGPPSPVEITLRSDTWLGRVGARLRGYSNPRWSFVGDGVLDQHSDTDLLQRHQALGSRAYLDFAAQPEFVSSFFQPHVRPAEVPCEGISPAS